MTGATLVGYGEYSCYRDDVVEQIVAARNIRAKAMYCWGTVQELNKMLELYFLYFYCVLLFTILYHSIHIKSAAYCLCCWCCARVCLSSRFVPGHPAPRFRLPPDDAHLGIVKLAGIKGICRDNFRLGGYTYVTSVSFRL